MNIIKKNFEHHSRPPEKTNTEINTQKNSLDQNKETNKT